MNKEIAIVSSEAREDGALRGETAAKQSPFLVVDVTH